MAVLFNESFESDGNGTRYTTSVPEFSDGFSDFFTRTDGATLSSSYEVAGADGDFYFAGQDIDGEGAGPQQSVTFAGIDVAGFDTLSLSLLAAEDDASDGNEDWDLSDFALVEYQLDGAGFQPLLAFESVPGGTSFNAVPALDTDFDGDGDGTQLTAVFAPFIAAIPGSGTLLDLRVTLALDSGDEDFAFDDITLSGDAPTASVTVLLEDFETIGNGTRYTTSIPEFSDGFLDFFGRTDGALISGAYEVSGRGGDFFFGAQDIDGEGAASQQTLSFTGLDIAGLDQLSFSALVAEDDASDGAEDWDLSDFVRIEVQIDGGGYEPILAIESVPDGDSFNAVPALDTDFDGDGDGAEITDTFQELTAAIAGTGSLLDLRITVDLDSGDEDIALDDIRIVGQSGGATPPAVLANAGDGLTVAEGGATDSFTLSLATDPASPVTVTVAADAQTEVSLDGISFVQSVDAILADSTEAATITVRAVDDALDETDPHSGTLGFTVASADPDYDGLAPSALTVSIGDNDVTITRIHTIQGDGAASPLDGQEVTVEAIVTGLFFDADGDVLGYFLQEEDDDADPDAATSEGIYVFDRDATVAVGDKLQVTGEVDERFGQTQIAADSVSVIDSGNPLPVAVAITLASGPDFEALEGMRVELLSEPGADPLTVVANFNLDRFGEIQVAEGNLVQPTQILDPDTEQAEIQALAQANADGRILIDDSAAGSNPTSYRLLEGPDGTAATPDNFDATEPQLRLGTELAPISGIMDFGFGSYRIQVAEPLETVDANPRPESAPEVGGDLTVASFNVLNYFTTLDDGSTTGPDGNIPPRGAATQFDLDRQTEKLVNAIVAMDADIIGLQEIENNGFGPGSAIATLVAALNLRTAPGTWAFVEPEGTNAGFIGTDAITTGIIYRPGAVTQKGDGRILVYEEASAATTFALAEALNPFASSDDQVGDFQRNRPAVAATFEDAEGNEVTIAVNHYKSKGDSNLEDLVLDAQAAGAPQPLIDALLADPNYDQDDGQAFWNQVRTDAAAELAAWLETNPTGASDTSNILVLGDLNAYAQENPVTTFEDAGFTDLAEEFIGEDAYSFVFDGQRGTLDYGLASDGILDNITGVGEWHIASDEPDLLNYSSEFKDAAYYNGADVFAASDHDPLLIGLDLSEAPQTQTARIEFKDRFFGDRLVYSVEETEIGSQKLRLFQREIAVDDAGITVDSDDGIFGPSFLTTLGSGLGVTSLFGDSWWGGEIRSLDEAETIGFALDDAGGLGDATEVAFEFKTLRGDGAVTLTFFDEEAIVDSVALDVTGQSLRYALDAGESFDRVEIGTTERLQLTVEAVEFERIDLGDAFLF